MDERSSGDTKTQVQVLVVCGDPVFAMDLEMLLTSHGFSAVVREVDELDQAGIAALEECGVAVIDIERLDDQCLSILNHLGRTGVPVVAVSSVDLRSFEDLPAVVSRHSKPLVVDELLPAIRRAGGDGGFGGQTFS